MANTFSPTLLVNYLQDGAITPLQHKLAAFKAFTRKFEPNPLAPLSKCEIKLPTTGATTQTNPTNFESGDSVVTNLEVTVNQYSHSFNVSNADTQSGLTFTDLLKVNAGAFAAKLMRVATAPITTTNFPAQPLLSSPGGFGQSDLDNLYGALGKSDVKNLILDPRYFIKVANKPTHFQESGSTSGDGWKKFGWNFIGENSEWSGAETNAAGFACNPQAIGLVAGLPIQPMAAPGLITKIVDVPGLEDTKCLFNLWLNTGTRTGWASFDIMLGAGLGDSAAGVLIKSGS